jgi:hypothetical protein
LHVHYKVITCKDILSHELQDRLGQLARQAQAFQFMETAILSHLPWLNEAVLVVQPSEDDTIEKAYRMANDHERIEVYEYPFECDWIDTPEFYAKDPHSPGHMVHMSNWAFTCCEYSWIVKVEGDVIATSAFANVIERVRFEPDISRYYGRVVLNVAGENCDHISWDNPRNGGWDEAVVPNMPDYHFERQDKWEVLQNPGEGVSMGGAAHETLQERQDERMEW